MEDVFVKKKKKKRYKITGIAILESTEIICHVTRQNLHFAHSSCNKSKIKKWQLSSGLTIKCFDLTMTFFGLVKNILGKQMIVCEK